MSKTLGKFRCKKCNTTHSQIYTSFGKGFEKRLAVISEVARVDFFKSCRDVSSKKVTDVCNRLLEEYNIAEKHYAYGGIFKPKSVWEKLGYDGDVLETMSLPENIIPDRMWGKLYRIPEIGIWERGTQGKRSAEELGSESTPRANRLRALPDVPERTEAEPTPETEAAVQPEPEEDRPAKADDISSSSSSSSDSSSSSSDNSSSPSQPLSKKDKKKKKAARKEKAKRKTAKKAEKRDAKRAKKDAEKQQLSEKEALKAAKQAEKDNAKSEKEAERNAKKAAHDEQNAVKKAAALLKTSAKASSGKLDKAIANAEKSLRAPGANLVSATQAEQLKTALESMRQEKAFCDNLVGGLQVPPTWQVPDAQDVKKITDLVKKYEGVYGLHVKAALQTASLAGHL
jgi:chemotaxis protein histidine kinase CheA